MPNLSGRCLNVNQEPVAKEWKLIRVFWSSRHEWCAGDVPRVTIINGLMDCA